MPRRRLPTHVSDPMKAGSTKLSVDDQFKKDPDSSNDPIKAEKKQARVRSFLPKKSKFTI